MHGSGNQLPLHKFITSTLRGWGSTPKLNELLIKGAAPANRPPFDQAWTLLWPPLKLYTHNLNISAAQPAWTSGAEATSLDSAAVLSVSAQGPRNTHIKSWMSCPSVVGVGALVFFRHVRVIFVGACLDVYAKEEQTNSR